ncbi:unnamed protein product [Musa banksii]
MQALVPKSVLIVRIPFGSPFHRVSALHSTPITLAKWKSKWDSKADKSGPKPSKTYVRYAVRQKRAEIKKALKDYLLYGKPSKQNCQDRDIHGFNDTSISRNFGKAKFHSSSSHGKCNHGSKRSRQKKNSSYDEDYYDNPETIYETVFGGHRGFTWSFESWARCHFSKSGTQFEWKDESRWEKTRSRLWSESDDEDNLTDVGSHSHRVALGLPPTGPLKLDDVKSAFRISALKWHPDKHQGPSQVMAAEKFKLCVDAYKSICILWSSCSPLEIDVELILHKLKLTFRSDNIYTPLGVGGRQVPYCSATGGASSGFNKYRRCASNLADWAAKLGTATTGDESSSPPAVPASNQASAVTLLRSLGGDSCFLWFIFLPWNAPLASTSLKPRQKPKAETLHPWKVEKGH